MLPTTLYATRMHKQTDPTSQQRQAQPLCLTPNTLPFAVSTKRPSRDEIFFTALFSMKGYSTNSKIAGSLQGSIWSVWKNGSPFVAKVACKTLYKKKLALVQGHAVPVSEDIVKEARILRHLSSQKCMPPSIAKFIDSFEYASNLVVIAEHGGTRLFNYIKQCHASVKQGKLALPSYQVFVRQAFEQIAECVDWMHNKMHCCHLDLSLENLTIMRSTTSSFQIKVIDFGVAELYPQCNFASTKCVGKPQYQSPEMYSRSVVYDARSADTWSLGVILFMMTMGHAPFRVASLTDQYYTLIKKDRRLNELVVSWKKESYVTPEWMNLITSVFVDENQRPTIKKLRNYPYFLY